MFDVLGILGFANYLVSVESIHFCIVAGMQQQTICKYMTTGVFHQKFIYKNRWHDWAWWIMPVIPAVSEAKVGGSLDSGVQDQSVQRGVTLSLLKKKYKNQPGMVADTCNPSTLGG